MLGAAIQWSNTLIWDHLLICVLLGDASIPMVQNFKVIVLLAVTGGCLGELPTVWRLADVAMGLMALVNLSAIPLFGRWAFGALADYEQALPEGAPLFTSKSNLYLPARIGTGVWRPG